MIELGYDFEPKGALKEESVPDINLCSVKSILRPENVEHQVNKQRERDQQKRVDEGKEDYSLPTQKGKAQNQRFNLY